MSYLIVTVGGRDRVWPDHEPSLLGAGVLVISTPDGKMVHAYADGVWDELTVQDGPPEQQINKIVGDELGRLYAEPISYRGRGG